MQAWLRLPAGSGPAGNPADHADQWPARAGNAAALLRALEADTALTHDEWQYAPPAPSPMPPPPPAPAPAERLDFLP